MRVGSSVGSQALVVFTAVAVVVAVDGVVVQTLRYALSNTHTIALA